MAAFYHAPQVIEAKALSRLTDWLPGSGIPPTVFLEGLATDTQGNVFVADVPYGRILKHDLDKGTWQVLTDYDGEPSGLALDLDGTLVYRCHPVTDFTDWGQTGMSDQTGLVYRLPKDGKLDTLLSNGVSPNGLVLSSDEKVLYVGMTRENSVWRYPLHVDGTTTEVSKFFSSFGIAGPDGLTVDSQGNLFICHPSLLSIIVVDRHGVPVARIVPPAGHGTSHPASPPARRPRGRPAHVRLLLVALLGLDGMDRRVVRLGLVTIDCEHDNHDDRDMHDTVNVIASEGVLPIVRIRGQDGGLINVHLTRVPTAT
ncbi:hypothetical protein Q5752_006813 [Cryptotrichosporon argae]